MDASRAAAVIEGVKRGGRKFVTEPEAKTILASYGVPVTRDVVCRTAEEAVDAARLIGFPVVMKVVSPQVVHKTEYSAVRVGVSSADEVLATYEEMVGNVRRRVEGLELHGVLVSETAKGQEMIIGSFSDPQFGQMLMFGLGGVNVEVFKDVSYRLAPLEEIDAREMVSELRGTRLLAGYRGKEGVDIEAVVSALMAVSRLVADFPDIVEMDLNPVFGTGGGVLVADARILLR